MGANSPPAITIDGKLHRQVQEGLAQVLAPYLDESSGKAKKKVNNDEGSQSVFYNPIQQFNRDLSVLAILTYGEGAVLEKRAKNVRKLEGKKARGKRLAAKTADEAQNGKKRKADELDEQRNVKRARASSPVVDAELKSLEQPGVDSHNNNNGNDSNSGETSENRPADATTTDATETTGNAESKQTKDTRTTFTILDALSASGIRAMRYAREIPFATTIIANDFSQEAVRSIELNINHNGVSDVVHSNLGDARAFMYSKVGNEHAPSPGYVHRFDVIDLDPYGTAAPFIDASLNAIIDGGLLCVTCTDAGVFASNGYPEKAYALYGGIPLKGAHSHEAGLRLILNSIATTAAKYGIAIEPLLSLSIDFYARVFIRVHISPSAVKMLAGTTMLVYSCDNGCGSWVTQPLARNQERVDRAGGTFFKHSFAQAPSSPQLCEHCSKKMHLGGPMWAGPLHNPEFVRRVLDRLDNLDKTTYGTLDRVRGMLTVALEEDLTLVIPRLPLETIDAAPLFFIPNYISKVLHCSVPTENAFRGALRHLGYRVTRSHCKAGSIKTNAPFAVIWEVMREWIRQKAPIKEGVLSKGQPGWEIMRKARDREDKTASAVKKSVVEGLESADGVKKEDVARILKAGLWTLEHEKEPSAAPEKQTETGEMVEAADGNGHGNSNGTEGLDNTAELGGPGAVSPPQVPPQGEKGDVSKLDVVFDESLGKEKPRNKLVRYQMNPRANWGPMNRAGGS
ncbi:hypothetical protein DV738_g3647, partial [Chaetothyriales sp. CBS 135597]